MANGERGFEVGDAIKAGWAGFKANAGPLIAALLVVFVANLVVNVITSQVNTFLGDLGAQILSFIVSTLVGMGLVRIALTVVDGGRPSISQLVITDGFVPYAIVSVLFGFAVVLGIVVFVVPGIYIALRWGLASYAVIDEGRGVADAFARASELSEGFRVKLLVLGVVLILLNVLGLVAFIVGVLVTGSISMVALAYVLRKLQLRPTAFDPRPI